MIAVAHFSRAVVYREKDAEVEQVTLAPLRDVRVLSLSPDGKWVLTLSHATTVRTVWDARTGRRITEDKAFGTLFSRDSQWLTDGRRRWRVGTWKEESLRDNEQGSPVAEGPPPWSSHRMGPCSPARSTMKRSI